MNRIIRILTSIVLLLLSTAAIAQTKPATQVTAIKQKEDHIRISLTSSKPFIFGSNIYVLYIGKKQFTRNDQWHKDGTGYMAFFISPDEYEHLQDGADIYLTYGEVDPEEENMQELAGRSRRCWALGQLDKSLLKK